jgi:4-amino-4-deoxy-L-arabinose transferase-like glycosyltransferase
MYKHYLFEGTWIHEDLYPSFKQPVLYYCSLGYPVLHYISGFFEFVFQCSFVFALKHLQFIVYLLSSGLIWLITKPYATNSQRNFLCLAYLWYLPFFNYAHLAMSETWFILFMLCSIYLFQLGISKQQLKWIALGFFVSGYTFLVRPVAGVMLPILLLLTLFRPEFKKVKLQVLSASLCFFLFPLIQAGFNKVVYDTWSLREGFSWNLWNRVVKEDGYDPNRSNATIEMKVTLKNPNFVAQGGYWWDITSQLSNLGMQPKEIQEYCSQICLDGIKDNPISYLKTSLERGLWTLPTKTHETVCIYSDGNGYRDFLNNYASRHHQPLLSELKKQAIENGDIAKFGIKIYSYWNTFFEKLNSRFFYTGLYIFLLLAIFIEIRTFVKYRIFDPIVLVLSSLPILMSLAACSLEVLHHRYYLPGIILEFIVLCILTNKPMQLKSKQTFKDRLCES